MVSAAGGTTSSGGAFSNAGSAPITVGGGAGAAGGSGVEVTIEDVVGRALAPAVWACGTTCALGDVASSAPDLFTGAATGAEPELLYPLADSMHPINLPDITFQWRKGTAEQTVFRIRLTGASATYDFYVPCGAIAGAEPDECAYTMPEGNWAELAFANRNQSVSVELSAADSSGANLGSSAAITLRFSPSSVSGGLYYWSTDIRGTYRLLFGAKKAEPLITPSSTTNPASCGGCHAVSRDGSTIAFSSGDAAEASKLIVTSPATPAEPSVAPGPTHDSATLAVSPDGSRVLSAFTLPDSGPVMQLRDSNGGAVLATWDKSAFGNKGAFYPEFSPDGASVVVTLASDQIFDWSVRDGAIAVLSFDTATNTLGTPNVIVPAGPDNNFYPTWSPDGAYVAFAAVPKDGSAASYDQANARLRLVAKGGGTVYDLTRATQSLGATSTMPKFAPFVQDDGNVMFLTFNSKMDYGATLKNESRTQDQRTPQLWMAALDLRNLASDPSWAPIWLPFQDVTQTNHLGYWTEQLTCKAGGCGGTDVICDVGSTGSGTCVFEPVK